MMHISGHPELEQQLGLYRIFLKLYEHHPGLLETILELETSNSGLQYQVRFPYVQAVIQNGNAYLITNLSHEHSQAIAQPENIWVIGRDHCVAISVSDPLLSRHHAAIQYLDGLVYLIDLASTNGSLINGEPVRQPTQLKDGDQIRLGSLSFTFFNHQPIHQAASIPPSLKQKVYAHHANQEFSELPLRAAGKNSTMERKPKTLKDENLEETVSFAKFTSVQAHALDNRLDTQIPDSLQGHILDRFFKRQTSSRSVQD